MKPDLKKGQSEEEEKVEPLENIMLSRSSHAYGFFPYIEFDEAV